MGIFSSIGKIAGGVLGGPFGSAIGSAAGGLLDFGQSKKDARKARAQALLDQRLQYSRLRKAAEKGGFNPLTVLNSGRGFGSDTVPTGYAPLSSSRILTDSLEPLGRELSGEAAQERKRQKVEDDFNRLQLERLRHDVSEIEQRTKGARVPGVMTPSKRARVETPETHIGPKLRTGKDPYKRKTSIGPMTFDAAPDGHSAKVSERMDPAVIREHDGPLHKTVTHSDGGTTTVPVGYDWDELATGWALETAYENREAIEAVKKTGLLSPWSFERLITPFGMEYPKSKGKIDFPKDHPMSH